jgi:hypothetical protein
LAQTTSRPYQGLFRGTSTETSGDALELLLNIAEAYDQNVLGDSVDGPRSVFQVSSFFTQLTADLSYNTNGRRMRLATSAGTDLRYYSSQSQLIGTGHHVSAGLSVSLSQDSTLSMSQTVAFAPSYLHRLFATAGATVVDPSQVNVASNYAITDSPSYSYGTTIVFTNKLSTRNKLTFQAAGRYTDYLTTPTSNGFRLHDLVSAEVGSTFTRSITRDVALNLGYAYKRVQYYGGDFPSEQDVNIGFEYSRPLSRTRRLQLKVSTASALLHTVAPGEAAEILHPQYRFIGDVGLTRQFGRTWQVDGSYHRGVGFIEGITTPVIMTGWTTQTGGRLSRRTSLMVTSGYSVGEPTIPNASSGFSTVTVNARGNVSVSRDWALYLEYLYYFYDFSSGIVPDGVPPRMARNGVRTGLTLWLPIGHR